MRWVAVVLFADALDEIRVRYQAPGQLDGPRLAVRLRIVNGDVDIHVADLRPGKALRDAQGFGPRQPSHVEPGPTVLSGGLDHQRVLVPMADRIPHPRGL